MIFAGGGGDDQYILNLTQVGIPIVLADRSIMRSTIPVSYTHLEELMRILDIDFRTIRPRYIGPHLERYLDGSFDTYWGIRRGGGFWGIPLNLSLIHISIPRTLWVR